MSTDQTAPPAPTGGRASSRVRTKVVRLAETTAPTPIKVEWTPTPGKGTAIKDMEHCFKYVNKMTRSDPNLQTLHKIFYGKRGLKATIKPHTADFSGLVYTEERTREHVLQDLYKWQIPQLKHVMDQLGVGRSSKDGKVDKEGLCARFCTWLEAPVHDSNSTANKAKTKKSEKKVSKKFKNAMKLDKNAPKKGGSAYIFFGKAQRATIVAANPEAINTEIMGLVGAAWSKLTDEEKVPYQKQADEDKIRYENEMKTYVPASPPVKKAKKKAKKKASSSSSSSSSSTSRKSKTKTKSKSKFKMVTEVHTRKPPPLFPHSRYMLTKNAPKPVKKKRKAKSTKSKRAKKKAKHASSEEEESSEEESEASEEEESEEEEEEEEVALPVPRGELKKAIAALLVGADLNTLSVKAIRKQLATQFKVDLQPVKQEMKAMIMAAVNAA